MFVTYPFRNIFFKKKFMEEGRVKKKGKTKGKMKERGMMKKRERSKG